MDTQKFDHLPTDDELRPHLEAGNPIYLQGLSGSIDAIEEQLKRLKFDDRYNWAVSRAPNNYALLTPKASNVVNKAFSTGVAPSSNAQRTSSFQPQDAPKKYHP